MQQEGNDAVFHATLRIMFLYLFSVVRVSSGKNVYFANLKFNAVKVIWKRNCMATFFIQ